MSVTLCLFIVRELSPEGKLVECEPYPIPSPYFDSFEDVADFVQTHADEVLYENEGVAYHMDNNMLWTSREETYLKIGGHRIDL